MSTSETVTVSVFGCFTVGFAAALGFACGTAVVNSIKAAHENLSELDEMDSYLEVEEEQSFDAELPHSNEARSESAKSPAGKKLANLLNIGLNIRINLSDIRTWSPTKSFQAFSCFLYYYNNIFVTFRLNFVLKIYCFVNKFSRVIFCQKFLNNEQNAVYMKIKIFYFILYLYDAKNLKYCAIKAFYPQRQTERFFFF